MKKRSKLSASIFAIAFLISLQGWAQSAKVENPGVSTTVTANPKSQANALSEARKANPNASAEEQNLRSSLNQARLVLQNGQADNSLNEKQVHQLKQKIASIENELKSNKVSKQNEANATTLAGNAKQVSRSQFLAMSEQQQRQLLSNKNKVVISDLINFVTVPQKRSPNVYYITEETFRNADVMKQISILKNPSSYVVVKNGTLLPKTQITRAQLNNMPAERRQHVLSSDKYEITD